MNVATLSVLTMVTVCESFPHQLFVYLFFVKPDTNLILLLSSLGFLSSVLVSGVGVSNQTVSCKLTNACFTLPLIYSR